MKITTRCKLFKKIRRLSNQWSNLTFLPVDCLISIYFPWDNIGRGEANPSVLTSHKLQVVSCSMYTQRKLAGKCYRKSPSYLPTHCHWQVLWGGLKEENELWERELDENQGIFHNYFRSLHISTKLLQVVRNIEDSIIFCKILFLNFVVLDEIRLSSNCARLFWNSQIVFVYLPKFCRLYCFVYLRKNWLYDNYDDKKVIHLCFFDDLERCISKCCLGTCDAGGNCMLLVV